MADALSQQGRDALAAGDLDAAIELFAQVLEQRRAVEAHGEKAVECAPAYVEYGKALLRKAQAADDPFGSNVPKETPVGVNPAAAAGGAGGEGGGAGGAGGEGGGEGGGKGGGEGDDGGDGGEGDADYEEGEEGGEGDEEEADDLELAFQCLEMARLALEQAPGRELDLAEVLEYLGEVQMENEMWEDAVRELERSLELKLKALPPDDRQLAHLHYQIATATVSLIEKKREDVKQHYTQAADVLRLRLAAAGGAPPAPGGPGGASGPPAPDADLNGDGHVTRSENAAAAAAAAAAAGPSGGGPSWSSSPPPEKAAELRELLAEIEERAPEHARTRPGDDLGVVGGTTGRKKAVLEPLNGDPAAAVPPLRVVSKRARVE
ncbi:hypothetical protein EMIHUDRAFT_456009 [Emiliania huxleyi CCMP1516]|uniref:Tetratricopeptide SHNi-TPR domain-containing protein n=2 Tax=Emiliania huxleyi TaxID=2903 RepID=A0A0D3KA38_EMIH1|nr:hypothetical protein EMIHUDRAFT_456009 [Emiliania huxleyi CCMP1516]EOD32623.1 hypothetical protein EMIHUDRAFT_456009 [Emiliania huxleyi CCMP1516]|eukprot:XP_005785052.1 hypothetical protein EMIHUDRAFT_456009 [Emiliania huxleyi CCMP1516]